MADFEKASQAARTQAETFQEGEGLSLPDRLEDIEVDGDSLDLAQPAVGYGSWKSQLWDTLQAIAMFEHLDLNHNLDSDNQDSDNQSHDLNSGVGVSLNYQAGYGRAHVHSPKLSLPPSSAHGNRTATQAHQNQTYENRDTSSPEQTPLFPPKLDDELIVQPLTYSQLRFAALFQNNDFYPECIAKPAALSEDNQGVLAQSKSNTISNLKQIRAQTDENPMFHCDDILVSQQLLVLAQDDINHPPCPFTTFASRDYEYVSFHLGYSYNDFRAKILERLYGTGGIDPGDLDKFSFEIFQGPDFPGTRNADLEGKKICKENFLEVLRSLIEDYRWKNVWGVSVDHVFKGGA